PPAGGGWEGGVPDRVAAEAPPPQPSRASGGRGWTCGRVPRLLPLPPPAGGGWEGGVPDRVAAEAPPPQPSRASGGRGWTCGRVPRLLPLPPLAGGGWEGGSQTRHFPTPPDSAPRSPQPGPPATWQPEPCGEPRCEPARSATVPARCARA